MSDQRYVIEITTLDASDRPLATARTKTPLRRDIAEQVLRMMELSPPKTKVALQLVEFKEEQQRIS